MPVLHVDDPKIGIELALARDEVRRSRSVDPVLIMQKREAPHAVIARFALRRGTEDRHPAVEAIDDDEDGARFGGAPFAQRRERAFDGAATQISGNPDIGAKARNAHGIAMEARAESAFNVRGFISPVAGSLLSRSNFWIAARVPGPMMPSMSSL